MHQRYKSNRFVFEFVGRIVFDAFESRCLLFVIIKETYSRNTRVAVILSFFLTKVVDFCPVSFGVAPEDRDLPRSNARGKPVGEEFKKKKKKNGKNWKKGGIPSVETYKER